ncbi:hypothetical protein EKO04_008203 [Ascochyta lentis]|uniref:Mur ligase central domain-containing protein n=1 Tax=Ascochyta lentis TaxID=205686 RepID=A0A8H7MHI1_9PLEO|nr:hypothetical protein EKO04_008203 [Ascochyta lentis]
MAKIQPGLERIAALLKDVSFPWRAIHVAGTNGKGSICHYASSLLVGRGIEVGKFTSPHLVDRWDCISIRGKPIAEGTFRTIEGHFLKINATNHIGASPFEILTATAFTAFNDANVQVGVVEVGMGGTLDSTNILNNQAVSVISKIARDHEGFLGNTLSEIAAHKAGILRPNVPYLTTSANEANVINVINDYAKKIRAGPQLSTRSFRLEEEMYRSAQWASAIRNAPSFQKENIKLALVAAMQTMQSMGQKMQPSNTGKPLLANLKSRHPGRQEMVRVPPVFRHANEKKNHVLVDGAHNPDAAVALNEVVRDNLRYSQTFAKSRPESGWPVTWVLAMTEGKDARDYLAKLLKPGDTVITTAFGPVDGMPWVKPMDPKKLLEVAKSVEPQITGMHVPVLGALRALSTAKYMVDQGLDWTPIVLTGSLYFVGDFHRELRPRSSKTWWTDTDEVTTADRESMLKIHAEERARANAALFSRDRFLRTGVATHASDLEAEEQMRLQDEIDTLDRKVQSLDIEEQRLAEERLIALEASGISQDGQSLSALERFERDEQRFVELHSTPERLAEQTAKAEKAKADLARQAKQLQAAAVARAERAEKRAQREARTKLRRERKLERMRLKGERGRTTEQQNEYQPDSPYEETVRPYQEAQQEKRRGRTEERVQEPQNTLFVSSSKRATIPKEAPTHNTETQDALSLLTKAAPKNPSYSQSTPSTPTQDPSRASSSNAQLNPNQGDADSPLDSPQRPKIHMHYANVALPRRSKLREFPVEKRTRAWTTPRGKNHAGYKTLDRASVVNYYEHEYGRRRG